MDKRLSQSNAAINNANYSTDIAANMRQTLQYKIDSEFQFASSYYEILKQNRITDLWETIGVRLTKPFDLKETTTIKDDYYNLIYPSNSYSNLLGDMFEFEGYRYMTCDVGRIKTPTNSCEVKRCNIQLKFTEASNLTQNIITLDGIADSKLFDPDTGIYVTLPTGNMTVLIQNNDNAKKIQFNSQYYHRFLLGIKNSVSKYQAWKVVGFDGVKYVRQTFADDTPSDLNGMIELRLQKDQIDPKDNHTLGVAWQKWF